MAAEPERAEKNTSPAKTNEHRELLGKGLQGKGQKRKLFVGLTFPMDAGDRTAMHRGLDLFLGITLRVKDF